MAVEKERTEEQKQLRGFKNEGKFEIEEVLEGDGEEEEESPPSHLPFAPTSELLDVSTTVDPSYIISLIRKLLPNYKTTEDLPISVPTNGGYPATSLENTNSFGNNEKSTFSVLEDQWEESGCILWDLSAEETHAKFMVENLLLEVLVANLTISNSVRVTEICLGIIGNLACHDVLSDVIVSTKDLIETTVNQLFHEDTASLCEACRLLTISLQGAKFSSWIEVLKQDCFLHHILWIAENTLNLQLLEKTIKLLLTMIERENVAPVFLPSLKKLGLPNLLVKILACEVDKFLNEHKLERISVIDPILESIEALSTIDSCSKMISSNEELFQILCDFIKLEDKIEVVNSSVSASVIVANILTDEPQLASKLCQDFSFLQGLLNILPFISTDAQARNALWSIMARLFSHVHVSEMSSSSRQRYVSLLAERSHLIEEDLDQHPIHDSSKDRESNIAEGDNFDMATSSLQTIASLLDRWIKKVSGDSDNDQKHLNNAHNRKAERLLECCTKYFSGVS